jgi:hypothetical protein|tara:strand:+ start:221 stop:769 length:549 start_codon:yes stop_codon:yes gene_type:complete
MAVSINGNTGVVTGLAQLPDSAMSAGSIIQVVSTVLTSAASFNVGNGATDNITGLSASITPSSSSNKILIMYSISYDISNISAKGGFRIKRGSTVIGNGDSAGNRYLVNCGYSSNNNEDQALMSCSNNFVDSPSTTSATTYQMCMHGGGTTQDIFINRARSDGNESDDPRAASSLILMEVSV